MYLAMPATKPMVPWPTSVTINTVNFNGYSYSGTIKPITITKFKFIAVLLAARLINFIQGAYEGVINITNT